MRIPSHRRLFLGSTACVCIAVAACNGSGSAGPDVYGMATIGPAGGELVVDGGPQAGLRLSVPPGALAAPTDVRVVSVPIPPPPPGMAVMEAQPGIAFALQPAGLALEVEAQLRVPYRTLGTTGPTSPYNVRVRRMLDASSYTIAPTTNDPVALFVDVPIRVLDKYQVVYGPVAAGIAAYRQPVGPAVALSDDFTFAVEEVPAGTPFSGAAAYRWRIRSLPVGIDDILYFDGEMLRGRESQSVIQDWREVWSQPYDPWQLTGPAMLPPPSLTTTIAVQTPIGAGAIGGTMTVWGFTSFAAPRTVAGQLFNDVVQLTITLAWSRHDIGVGQRQYTLYFAPGVGLLALSQDAVVYERTSL